MTALVSVAETITPDVRVQQSIASETNSTWRPDSIVGGRAKRAFDIVASLALIVFLAPLLVIAALLVKMGDGGPSVYSHERIGVGGRRFRCLKFRSMAVDSAERLKHLLETDPEAAREWALNRKLRQDPRVTPIGRFLRKTSIDEFPQLLNVLRGDMSLVGPRPIVQEELSRYDLARVHYLRTRPGMTGLWQVSGRSNTSYKRRIELDKAYALHQSFGGDISILLRTVPALLSSSGAH